MRTSIRLGLAAIAVSTTVLAACSGDRSAASRDTVALAESAASAAVPSAAADAVSKGKSAEVGLAPAENTGSGAVTGAAQQPSDVAVATQTLPRALTNRKIIRTADITIEVTDVPDAVVKLRNLVATTGGFLATEQATYGATDQVSLSFRVPVEQFDVALTRLGKIGSVLATNISSEEVTAQYRDLESRIRSKKLSAERLRQLITQAVRPADILEIENELSNREAEIESMQGQMNMLGDQSALSTIRVQIVGKGKGTVVEIRKKQEPSFTRAWKRSVDTLVDIAQALGAAAGAVLPFLPLVGIAAVVLVAMSRRSRKTTGPDPTPDPTPDPVPPPTPTPTPH